MLEENEEIREETGGVLRAPVDPEAEEYLIEEERRRSELLDRIKNGEFETH